MDIRNLQQQQQPLWAFVKHCGYFITAAAALILIKIITTTISSNATKKQQQQQLTALLLTPDRSCLFSDVSKAEKEQLQQCQPVACQT
jgi:hypothetical protein